MPPAATCFTRMPGRQRTGVRQSRGSLGAHCLRSRAAWRPAEVGASRQEGNTDNTLPSFPFSFRSCSLAPAPSRCLARGLLRAASLLPRRHTVCCHAMHVGRVQRRTHPYSLPPHAQHCPSSSSASTCHPPMDACLILTPASSETEGGQAGRGARQDWPCSRASAVHGATCRCTPPHTGAACAWVHALPAGTTHLQGPPHAAACSWAAGGRGPGCRGRSSPGWHREAHGGGSEGGCWNGRVCRFVVFAKPGSGVVAWHPATMATMLAAMPPTSFNAPAVTLGAPK